jgi:hypothetical protein
VVTLAPDRTHPYEAAEWRDALVIVDRGEIELEGLSGGRWHFRQGDVLWFTGLPLRTLRNPGREPAVLIALTRRGADGTSRGDRG